jgi:transcriptional regulator with XRE-family HTH domain
METDPLAVEIGSRIRAQRAACDMTGRLLAEKVGVPATTITVWERGRVIPGGRSLILLARALGCRVSALLPDDDGGAATLSARIERLSAGALADLERFVSLLERAERIPSR